MKIERINPNKIKISISQNDLRDWRISIEQIAQNTMEARQALLEIVREAERATGFSARNAQIMIEVMPSENDGIIMFATRLGDRPPVTLRPRSPLRGRKPRQSEAECYWFAHFDALQDYARAAAELPAAELYELDGAYYLWVPGKAAPGITEFAQRVSAGPARRCRLAEHGTRLGDGVLSLLKTVKSEE